jgi:hypothetical protein
VCATEQTANETSSKLPPSTRGALQGVPLVLCRIGLLSRSGRYRTTFEPARARDHVSQQPGNRTGKVRSMLYTIAVVLLILWLLGLVTSYTLGGFIHILLVVAVIMVLVNLISGRRSV